jgi:hypothetical protein
MGLYLRCRRLQSGAAAQADRGGRLIAKVPGFAKAHAGRWRIVEMDVWDNDFLNLVEEAHLTLQGKSDGEIAFGALKGFLGYSTRDGSACAEFSWGRTGREMTRLRSRMGYDRHCWQSRRPSLHTQWRRFRLRLRTRLSSSTAC